MEPSPSMASCSDDALISESFQESVIAIGLRSRIDATA
jgi:hypothetical protein